VTAGEGRPESGKETVVDGVLKTWMKFSNDEYEI